MKENSFVARRRFLKWAGLTATIGPTFGFTSSQPNLGDSSTQSKYQDVNKSFEAVKVSSDRVIRTVVGLRPYRASGFVVKSERVNNKTIIHNYGHGGAGVTLSWGTAKLAVDLALQTKATTFAVLGCGVIGLSTARLLQRKGFQVTIYAKDLPPETTSNIAGALWFPTSVYEESKIDSKFLNQFDRACKISHRIFQDYVGDNYGVWWIKNFSLGFAEEFPGGRELYPEIEDHRDPKIYFGFEYAQQFSTMMIEPAIYLNAVLRDFYLAGGKLHVRQFNTTRDITSLPESAIMNCTGLGSRKLFNDEELTPVKGQLSILLPQPEIDYSYVAAMENNLLYMFPRKDGIVLGGTTEHGNWSIEPSVQESERILKGHSMISKSLGG
jgi:glycine/D-amino acid oxidase-like deaminating enzyme